MRYEITMMHPETGEQREITVELNEGEKALLGTLTERRDLFAQCYALTHAYRQAPKGFQHIKGAIRAIAAH
jgi:hypothetical protein